MEMQKSRKNGGIKLIKTKVKSETPKIEWLINIITDPNLQINLSVFRKLVGTQKGNIEGEEVMFADHSFMKNTLKINDEFYLEALRAISKLEIRKHVQNLEKEPIFYNPMFKTIEDENEGGKTIKPFRGNNRLSKIKTYEDLLEAEKVEKLPLKAAITQKIRSIQNIKDSAPTNRIRGVEEEVEFQHITQKFIYGELIHQQSRDHIYQTKWITDRDEIRLVNWDKTWESIHQQFFSEKIKSTVWEQIHLNFYTTHNYNKWHNTLQPCPLCNKIPEDIYHIILDCNFTNKMWRRLEKTLMQIIPTQVTNYEKAFGLQPRVKKEEHLITLRNWLTFTLRHLIMAEEKSAYHHRKNTEKREGNLIFKYKRMITEEIATGELYYKFSGREEYFEKILTAKRVIACKNEEGNYELNNFM